MCSQFLEILNLSSLQQLFGVSVPIPEREKDGHKVLPYTNTWVVIAQNKARQVKQMQFSLVPSWSKEKKVKFATHNARIESLLSKPTWKTPIQRRRALVPMSAFIEPIYRGQYQGNMVRFVPSSEPALVACAVYDHWRNSETDQLIESFAIITSEPGSFVRDAGHDRQPVFLPQKHWDVWLNSEDSTGEEAIELMHEKAFNPELRIEIDRPLKPGWEKRAHA